MILLMLSIDKGINMKKASIDGTVLSTGRWFPLFRLIYAELDGVVALSELLWLLLVEVHGVDEDNHELVLGVLADSNAHEVGHMVEELFTVFCFMRKLPFVSLPSSMSSSDINSLGSMKPQKVSSIRCPFHSENYATNYPTSKHATQFSSCSEASPMDLLLAARCSGQDHSTSETYLWLSKNYIRFSTAFEPYSVSTEKLKPVRGWYRLDLSYLESLQVRQGISERGSVLTLLISLRRIEARLVQLMLLLGMIIQGDIQKIYKMTIMIFNSHKNRIFKSDIQYKMEAIKLKLPNAREKLQALFPEDKKGDFRIAFGSKTFRLQKAFLRLQSGYFKKLFTINNDSLQLKQNFHQNRFSNVLKCFYGASIDIPRSEVLQYFPIIKFLEVESLLKILREDMNKFSQHYDIFVLLQLAHRFDQQEIFETCLLLLEREGFEQLRYGKLELLKCPPELFKMVIKTHNRCKGDTGKGIQFTYIDQIIRDYCEQRKLPDNTYQELKFDLIDKKSLSAQQYKEIFLDDAKRKGSKSMIKFDTFSSGSSFGGNFLTANSKLTSSIIGPVGASSSGGIDYPKKMVVPDQQQLTLQMENTFEKKLNEQLKAENSYLAAELNKIKQGVSENKSMTEDLKRTLLTLKKTLDQKQKQDKNQKNTINNMEKRMTEMRKELIQKGELINVMEEKIEKLVKGEKRGGGMMGKKYIDYGEEEEKSRTIQSFIVPAKEIKNLVSNNNNNNQPAKQSGTGFTKKKVEQKPIVEEELDQDDYEDLYSSRMEFDKDPSTPKKHLVTLANLLSGEDFNKKKLNLIYRRNSKESIGTPEQIYNKSSLLVLIHTKQNQFIGGLITVTIEKGVGQYHKDENAMLFSLSKDKKFAIKKTSVYQAVFMSDDYLLCFASDLMIAKESLKQYSDCSWPSSYEKADQANSKWLTGEDGAFSIRTLDIYELEEEAMTMEL